jgi:hypothetical protein
VFLNFISKVPDAVAELAVLPLEFSDMPAGTAQTSQKWRPLPIAPALMGLIARASGAVAKIPAARSSSAELHALEPSSFAPANAELTVAVSAACEQTPLPSEQGLKRRRHSDEILRPGLKQRTAGMLLCL